MWFEDAQDVGSLGAMAERDETPAQSPALSFGRVADVYARARPSYPREAAAWLVESERSSTGGDVLELGAGTGKLTEQLLTLGHRVIATDPLAEMLQQLREVHPHASLVCSRAERIPLRSRSVDVVVVAQAFHWFDIEKALPEIARVLRPNGHLALVWNLGDERVPWVRRLGVATGSPEQAQDNDPTNVLLKSNLFGFVQTQTFRFWQPIDRAKLHDLVLSKSYVAVRDESDRREVLARVDALYDEFGRGADGMLMPYLTHCYKAVVRPPALEDETDAARADDTDDGGDALLIDFP
jgi:SAM-dependent methyltransferase